MNLYSVIWKEKFVEKLAAKYGVEIEEVEEVKFNVSIAFERSEDIFLSQ